MEVGGIVRTIFCGIDLYGGCTVYLIEVHFYDCPCRAGSAALNTQGLCAVESVTAGRIASQSVIATPGTGRERNIIFGTVSDRVYIIGCLEGTVLKIFGECDGYGRQAK